MLPSAATDFDTVTLPLPIVESPSSAPWRLAAVHGGPSHATASKFSGPVVAPLYESVNEPPPPRTVTIAIWLIELASSPGRSTLGEVGVRDVPRERGRDLEARVRVGVAEPERAGAGGDDDLLDAAVVRQPRPVEEQLRDQPGAEAVPERDVERVRDRVRRVRRRD